MVLLEIDRKNLVGKTKVQSPTRYNKRMGYRAKGTDNIDFERILSNDMLVVNERVGDYVCTVAYSGIIHKLVDVIRKQPRPNVTLQSVIRAVTQSIDDTDVFVDCTCADFKYRYAYWATKYGYKYGTPETRPAKVTNPNDKIGAMCKHLTALLANKRWLVKVASLVNDFIKANYDDVLEAIGLSPDEFIINVPGRPSRKTGRNTRMLPREKEPENDINNDNEEELEIDDQEEGEE